MNKNTEILKGAMAGYISICIICSLLENFSFSFECSYNRDSSDGEHETSSRRVSLPPYEP